jgi:hypothetical protein
MVGDSGKPVRDTAGMVYSKRFMARDQVGLMRQLVFGQFQLLSHDRGASVAEARTVLSPGRVKRQMPDVLARLRFASDHRWAPARMSAFVDQDLTAHQRMRMERHVSECRRCRGLLTGLRLVVAALHRLPSPPDGDVARIAASVRVRLSEPV